MFSLRMLFAVVTIAAVYVAAILYRTPWWAGAILLLTYAAYAAAGTAAILSQKRRAFCAAFLIFGLAYGISVFYVRRDRNPTEIALVRLAFKLPDKYGQRGDPRYDATKVLPHQQAFISISHSVLAVLISLVAGVVAQAVVNRSTDGNESVNPPVPPRPPEW
jgi:hypothetical protein